MSIGSGLGASVGFKAESTYGTPVVVDHFLPFESEDLKKVKGIVQGNNIEAGQMALQGAWRGFTTEQAAGTIKQQVYNQKSGLLLSHLMGDAGTPVQQGSTTAYLQTHALADNFGKSLTVQVGVPSTTGTVNPYTFQGAKVTQAQFACAVDTLLDVTWTFDAQAVIESQGLAAPSYPTGLLPFHFRHLTVKVGSFGSEASISGVKGVDITLARPLATDRFYLGAAGLKAEPIMNERWTVTGSLDMDLVNKADIADLFASDGHTSLILEWKMPTAIASTYYPTFSINIPMVFFEGDTPVVAGPGITTGSFSFTGLYDGTNSPTTINYMSTDTTL